MIVGPRRDRVVGTVGLEEGELTAGSNKHQSKTTTSAPCLDADEEWCVMALYAHHKHVDARATGTQDGMEEEEYGSVADLLFGSFRLATKRYYRIPRSRSNSSSSTNPNPAFEKQGSKTLTVMAAELPASSSGILISIASVRWAVSLFAARAEITTPAPEPPIGTLPSLLPTVATATAVVAVVEVLPIAHEDEGIDDAQEEEEDEDEEADEEATEDVDEVDDGVDVEEQDVDEAGDRLVVTTCTTGRMVSGAATIVILDEDEELGCCGGCNGSPQPSSVPSPTNDTTCSSHSSTMASVVVMVLVLVVLVVVVVEPLPVRLASSVSSSAADATTTRPPSITDSTTSSGVSASRVAAVLVVVIGS
uniref:Uncharacterized protein n=1 Tax=Anopheles farauti TaxID=69004 RepID=A0A182Q2L6_9DIPT